MKILKLIIKFVCSKRFFSLLDVILEIDNLSLKKNPYIKTFRKIVASLEGTTKFEQDLFITQFNNKKGSLDGISLALNKTKLILNNKGVKVAYDLITRSIDEKS